MAIEVDSQPDSLPALEQPSRPVDGERVPSLLAQGATSLNDLIEDAEGAIRQTLGETVALVISLEPDPWTILADRAQMREVLVSLAQNAREAMPAAGVLTISTENIDVDEAYAATRPSVRVGRYARLRVSDTGIGMSPEVARHAFDAFFTTKPEREGSGLGLATVQWIITRHGGDVRLYSEPGTGTTVSALLPAVDQMPLPRTDPSPDSGRGETILLVEDDGALLEISRRILDRHGYRVITALGGGQALAWAEAHRAPIDLLITDVAMPHMDGRQVAEAMGRMQPGLRVLYMSGYARPVLASRGALETGVTLLEKPFSEATLLANVREILQS